MASSIPAPSAAPEPATLTDEQRARIWRAFVAWTGQRSSADDLTQETMLEAWRSTQRPPTEPALTRWLFGVARNVLHRYRREQGRESSRHIDVPDDDQAFALASETFDIDATLEREDIVALLDAALARIPAASRQAILLRYIDELPQREIAQRLGVNEKALEGKLQRGKRAMHRYLVTDGQESLRALGLGLVDDTWQVTNLWCDGCGRQRLLGRWYEDGGFRLDCPSCTLLGGRRSHHTDASREQVGGLRSFGAGTRRIMRDLYVESLAGYADSDTCPLCSGNVEKIRFGSDTPNLFEFWLRCTSCGAIRYRSSIGVAGSHPTFQRWMKQERRVAFDPSPPLIERDGREAVTFRWQSLTSGSTWEAVTDRLTLRHHLIAIDGQPLDPTDPDAS